MFIVKDYNMYTNIVFPNFKIRQNKKRTLVRFLFIELYFQLSLSKWRVLTPTLGR
jgi:hypothetical protein